MSINDERERLLEHLVSSLNAVESGLKNDDGHGRLTTMTQIMAAIVAKMGPAAVYADARRYAQYAAGIADAVLLEVRSAARPSFTLPPEVQ
jgi:hypothetical protein